MDAPSLMHSRACWLTQQASPPISFFFFFNDTPPTEISTLPLHDALPIPQGRAIPAVLVAAELCGVEAVFKVGGAQAIAALAYGTASVPKVEKIFGPGNTWVTAAKQLVANDPAGAACDLPAGPSQMLGIADASGPPGLGAAGLLAQGRAHAPARAPPP